MQDSEKPFEHPVHAPPPPRPQWTARSATHTTQETPPGARTSSSPAAVPAAPSQCSGEGLL